MTPLRRTVIPLAMFLLASAIAQAGVLADHPGYWLGDLKVADGSILKIGVESFTRADGSAWASVASPDQGAYDIPVTRLREARNTVELDLPMAAMRLTWVDDHFDAEWKQNGPPLPMSLRAVAQFPRRSRPQSPTAPFPYADKTLAVQSTAGVMLGATLSLPAGVASPDLAILVHGSGPSTRDAEVDGHRTFAVLADQLARRGVAVLRYDKRGISRSTGDYQGLTQKQLADDLVAVVRALAARKQFARIGLIGHSEGSAIAAAVAARHPDWVDFIVSLAGVGMPGVDLMLLQDRLVARDQGADPAELARVMPFARSFYETVVAQPEVAARTAALETLHASLSSADKALINKYHMDEGTLSLAWARQPFLRDSLISDPRSNWQAVRCPVLALNGDADHQVPPENLAGIVASLGVGANQRVQAAILPSVNHMFQTAKTGAVDEYAAIDETIAPTVIQRIGDFILRPR
jgi:hypothetical protein